MSSNWLGDPSTDAKLSRAGGASEANVRIGMSAAQVQRRRRALSAAARPAAREQEKADEPVLVREYSIEALSLAVRGSTAKVIRLVEKGLLPKPSRVIEGRSYCTGTEIEPALPALGYRPSGVPRDAEARGGSGGDESAPK